MAIFWESFITEISILTLLATTVYLFFKYRYTYWARHGIEQVPPSIPFGNFGKLFLRQKHIGGVMKFLYDELKKKNVPYGGYYSVIKPELLLISPDLIKQILIKDFSHFTDRQGFSDEKLNPLTHHLFFIGGQKWKNLRTKLSPTFTSGKMKMMFNTLAATSDELNNILEQASKSGEPIDIKDILARFTTDVIGSCAFGIECNSLKDPNVDFRVYGKKIFQLSPTEFLKRTVFFLSPYILSILRIPALDADLNNFFIGSVRSMVKYREENKVVRKDFLQLLLELKRKGYVADDDEVEKESINEVHSGDGKSLTIEEMAAQCFVFFIAGFETSSSTMSFTLFELTQNPHIQEKLREEVVKTLEKHGGITYDAIMEMKYLDKVVNETLRKYPIVPFLFRTCTKDYNLPGKDYTVKVGDTIRISVFGMHRDPEYYPNPDKFDPERFSEEENSKRPQYTYIPFGEGPRICIGQRFGLMQSKVGLAVLLKNYVFTLNDKTKQPVELDPTSVFLSIKGNIWLNAKKIKS